jgi:hypothetical protein
LSPSRTVLFRRFGPWGLVAVAWIAFGAGLRFGFASEDFLILARFESASWWSVVAAEFRGPWLGLEHVAFYRPVAMALVGLQHALWGLRPWAYHGAQILLHGINAVLVYRCAWRLLAETKRPATFTVTTAALATALLFLLFPLHLGTVLFLGSYATLWSGFFQLLALRSYLRALGESPQGTRWWAQGLAVAGFLALALGCYEAAAVLPLALLAVGLALAKNGPTRRRAGALLLPSAAVLTAYFVLRRAVLGVFVGGYGFVRERWLDRLFGTVQDAFASLPRLLLGQLELLTDRQAALVGFVLCALIGTALLRWRGPYGRVAALGLAWALLFQLPFGFAAVVPATGRFWYLATVGSALVLGAAVAALAGLGAAKAGGPFGWQFGWRGLAFALLLPLMLLYALGLRGDLAYYRQADQESRALLASLATWEASLGDGTGGPLLVAEPPSFVHNAKPSPVAKVFQYGLTEAARPPFGSLRATVIPLPAYVPQDRWAALAAASGGQVRRWSTTLGSLVPIPEPGLGPGLPPGRLFAAQREGDALVFSCRECREPRLFVVTRDATFRGEPFAAAAGRVALPTAFLRGMAGLAGGTAYWWLEERGPGGGLLRATEIGLLELAAL